MIVTADDMKKMVPPKRQGIHCSLYLPLDSYEQLISDYGLATRRIERLLAGRMSSENIKKFLRPLNNYIHSKRLLPHFEGSLAIFRTQEYFRALKVNSWVPMKSVIASSFHIKPLLEEKQKERHYNFLMFQKNDITFYEGRDSHLEERDRFYFDVDFEGASLGWLEAWINRLLATTHRPVFWASQNSKLSDLVVPPIKSHHFQKVPLQIDNQYESQWQLQLHRQVLKRLKDLEKDEICHLAREIHLAEQEGRVSFNLFQVARSVVANRVSTLLVASDHEIWGELDEQTGGLSIHPDQINHRDDDLLDDLAEKVIESGGQVLVLPKEEIPSQTGVLAILKRESSPRAQVGGLSANY